MQPVCSPDVKIQGGGGGYTSGGALTVLYDISQSVVATLYNYRDEIILACTYT